MNTKILSTLWFVGGSIFGIMLAYTLGTQTVFEPVEMVANQPPIATSTNTPIQNDTPELTGDIAIASSTAPELDTKVFDGPVPIQKAFRLKTSKSIDGIDVSEAALFAATPFRTVAVTYSTSSEGFYRVVVASTRNSEANHDMCGSMYSASHACYFFLEPESIADLSEKTIYLGSLQGGGFSPNSLHFTSTSTVEFITGEGDAGWSFERHWQLDLNTKTITLVKEISNEYNETTDTVTTKTRP